MADLQKVFSKHFYFNDDEFKDLMMFEKIIMKDKNIINSIPEKKRGTIKANGILSYGVKFLISSYVNKNRTAYFAAINRKQKQDEADAGGKEDDN